MTVDLESLAREALEDAKRGTPGPWTSSDFEIYPSEGGPDVSCDNGCDGGCDDDERAPIQCARVSHATEVIADVYGLQQFAAEAGRFIAAARTREPLLAAEVLRLTAEVDRLRKYEEAVHYLRYRIDGYDATFAHCGVDDFKEADDVG